MRIQNTDSILFHIGIDFQSVPCPFLRDNHDSFSNRTINHDSDLKNHYASLKKKS